MKQIKFIFKDDIYDLLEWDYYNFVWFLIKIDLGFVKFFFDSYLLVKFFENINFFIEEVVQYLMFLGQYVWVCWVMDKEFLDVVQILIEQVVNYGFWIVVCYDWGIEELVNVLCVWVGVIIKQVKGDEMQIDVLVLQIKVFVINIVVVQECLKIFVL